MKASSVDNLKPRKKGDPCIHRQGRPRKEVTFSDLARKKAGEICDRKDARGRTWAQYLVDKWFEHSVDSPHYFKELLDRTDGKVLQPVDANIRGDVNFIIGKGYANDQSDVQPDQQATA